MKRQSLIALLFVSLLSQSFAQDDVEAIPELDVVENEDLTQLLNDAEKNPVTTVTEETPAAPAEAPVNNADLANLESLDNADTSLSEAVQTADQDLPQPLPENAGDDLDELKTDLRDTDLSEGKVAQPDFTPADKVEGKEDQAPGLIGPKGSTPVVNDPINVSKSSNSFDVGNEEKQLLELASSVQGQISNNEWNELATQAKVSSYTVVKDDWLFKISKRLFGSGFYYPKIWALNQFITNPHLIEPGMILSFTTGSGDRAPEIKLGEFSEAEIKATPGASTAAVAAIAPSDDFSVWGDEAKPEWLTERKSLIDQGVFVQYSTSDTIKDLEEASRMGLIKEYENYEPPQTNLNLQIPANQYDRTGLDKNSKIVFKFKEGFYLNTFVTNNPVQDFGKLEAGPDENIYFTPGNHMYIQFDESVNVLPGDRFSIYSAQGKVTHHNSDRTGFKYTITGQIRVIAKVGRKWEVELETATGVIARGDRVTVYTPKIDRLTQTFNRRLIEGAIIGTHAGIQTAVSFGDVIYIDRGRADGLEIGNILEMYGFKDRATGKVIEEQPTYKTGEISVITLTDNFATCLVTSSTRDFYVGDIAVTKTKEAALRIAKEKNARIKGVRDGVDDKSLEELDVELRVEDLNDSLLDKADKLQLTEDELAELERQEREKSIIKDSERDLKALERLEKEIEGAEKLLNEAKLDEDKLLDGQNLEEMERKRGLQQQESLDEIEENLGKRYIDENLNNKDNPYGLTEFDIEEVDELLNTEKPKEGAGN
ncbi:MAG: LysM peptidoglycan-binding domain-containing protein [Bacteriovoracaceae bacterium]|nr:LysM peptidoglycan-binding domain-containing protein [Bacteriovoracaceae bacterium]